MGRGGGSTSGGGGGGGGFKLSKNPIVNGVFFAICAVVFAVCTIAIPIYLVVSPAGDRCSVATSLNLGEQLFCRPLEDKLDETYVTDPDYPKDVKTYYIKADEIANLKLTHRSMAWKNYKAYLNEAYEYFSIASVYYTKVYLTVTCTGSKCTKAELFWLTEENYNKCFDANGDFVESLAESYSTNWVKDLSTGVSGYVESPSGIAENMYLVFSNHKEKGVTITYNLDIDYTVFDMSPYKAEKCGGDCEYDDMKKGDVIFMEYLEGKHDWMEASIHNEDINWSAVFASAAIFAILTILCIILAVVFLYKVIKKGVKVAKKIDKKMEKEQKKQAEADAAAAATAQPAYADPSYGQQQPYPGQPAYPGQM